jgi:hypothetical protein
MGEVTFLLSGRRRRMMRSFFVYGGTVNANGRSRSRAILVSSTGQVRYGVDLNDDGFAETERGFADQPLHSCLQTEAHESKTNICATVCLCGSGASA